MSIASEITRLQGAKADLATAIEGKGVTVPSATKLDGYADLVDAISQGGGGGTMQSKSVSYTPSTSAQSQTVTADAGYEGLSSVAVSVAAMPSGTEGTPTATKGTVSNHSIAVTPSVTNSAGYIAGGTKTGTAVTVSASELVTGYQIKTANGTYDVTNLASLIVNVPNTYTASDEGKVVSNGALVAQTSDTVTANDTYDTTLINSLTVNVSGGGGITIDEMASGEKPSGDIVIGSNIVANAFYGRTAITGVTVSGSAVRECGASAFQSCTNLTKVFGPIGWNTGACRANTNLVHFISTANANVRGTPNYVFYGCSKLEAVDLSHRLNVGLSSAFGTETFRNCSVLNTLILRENEIFGLGNLNAFNGTPFASGGTGGDIYIPKTLYDALGTGTNDYKAASNWSTVDGYGTITWHAIEGSYYATHYADGTLIPT